MIINRYFFHRSKQQLCTFSKFHQFLSAFDDWLAFILILNFVLWLFIYIWLLKFGRRYAEVISGNPFATKGFVKTLFFLNYSFCYKCFTVDTVQNLLSKKFNRRIFCFVLKTRFIRNQLIYKVGRKKNRMMKIINLPLDTYIVIYVFKVIVSWIHIFIKAFGKMHFGVGVSE